jgi:predicted transport protein
MRLFLVIVKLLKRLKKVSDIKLFSIAGQSAQELEAKTAVLEKDLQNHIERHMEVLLGVRFLATEYSTGKTHKGRIDSLGLDENGCPVIVEYKRYTNENVINQGLFYLDWLLDHQAEFKWLVMDSLGKETAEAIEWNGTRLICIASDFNKYDEHAVQQINRNIELMRYRYFGAELLLLELVNAQTVAQIIGSSSDESGRRTADSGSRDKTQSERLAEASPELVELFQAVCSYSEQLGDEVQRKELKLYTVFKRIRNFMSVVVMPGKNDPKLLAYLKLPGESANEDGFTRNVTNIGHWGTGNFEVIIRNQNDWLKAKELILQSYEAS